MMRVRMNTGLGHLAKRPQVMETENFDRREQNCRKFSTSE